MFRYIYRRIDCSYVVVLRCRCTMNAGQLWCPFVVGGNVRAMQVPRHYCFFLSFSCTESRCCCCLRTADVARRVARIRHGGKAGRSAAAKFATTYLHHEQPTDDSESSALRCIRSASCRSWPSSSASRRASTTLTCALSVVPHTLFRSIYRRLPCDIHTYLDLFWRN